METHDDWCDPAHAAEVLKIVNSPAICANWDIMHPVKRGGATMDEAFDALRNWYSPFNANKEYLRILHTAATTMESEVETALVLLLESGAMFSSDHVKELVGTKRPTVPMITPPRVDLAEYNILLNKKEVAL